MLAGKPWDAFGSDGFEWVFDGALAAESRAMNHPFYRYFAAILQASAGWKQ